MMYKELDLLVNGYIQPSLYCSLYFTLAEGLFKTETTAAL